MYKDRNAQTAYVNKALGYKGTPQALKGPFNANMLDDTEKRTVWQEVGKRLRGETQPTPKPKGKNIVPPVTRRPWELPTISGELRIGDTVDTFNPVTQQWDIGSGKIVGSEGDYFRVSEGGTGFYLRRPREIRPSTQAVQGRPLEMGEPPIPPTVPPAP